MLGKGFIIEHCLMAFRKSQEEKIYRVYLTDALQALTKNTTHYLTPKGMEDYGASLKTRWIELMTPPEAPAVDEDPRSCEEIAADIWERIRGKKP